jgi:hypothetical protein
VRHDLAMPYNFCEAQNWGFIKGLFMEARKMKKKTIILMLGVLLFAEGLFQSAVAYDYVYIDDGQSHLIGDAIYQNSSVTLDYHVANIPGTHFQVANGGDIWTLNACNNSTIEVDGGSISYGISMSNNSELGVNGGTIGAIWSYGNSLVEVNGGAISGGILASGNSTVEIRGAIFANLSALAASSSGRMYLYGSNFSVGGAQVNYGDSLRGYGVVGGANNANLTGVITGTLLDGSLLNSEFFVPLNNPGGADIIVIPEPTMSTLFLTASVLLLLRRR